MSLPAVLLILLSTFMHAGWNYAVKKAETSVDFFLIACLFSSLFMSPLMIIYRGILTQIPRPVWFMLMATGFFQAVYFASLVTAYRSGDISTVYPVARSLPVILIPLVSAFTGKASGLGWLYVPGAVLIVAGCLFLPLENRSSLKLSRYASKSFLFALLTAMGTTGYSLIDDTALEILRGVEGATPFAASVTYIVLQSFSNVTWLALLTVSSRRLRRSVPNTFRTKKRMAAITGVGIYATYLLVLIAFAFVRHVSYAVAFRQLSILLGALSGIIFLKEPAGRLKIAGLAAIFAGLLLVVLG